MEVEQQDIGDIVVLGVLNIMGIFKPIKLMCGGRALLDEIAFIILYDID